jgi:hypothetical protein
MSVNEVRIRFEILIERTKPTQPGEVRYFRSEAGVGRTETRTEIRTEAGDSEGTENTEEAKPGEVKRIYN